MTKTLLSLALACSPLVAAPDTVDTAWAGTAGSYFDSNAFGGPASMLIQPDGKLLVGSNWMSAQGGTIFQPLTRFNVDGTIENTFHADDTADGKGSGIFYDQAGQPEVHGLALQSDGKIIAVGCMQGMRDGLTNGSSTNVLLSNGIVRITANGDPDTTFQSAGIDVEFIDEVITLPNDKIVIMGGFNLVRNQGGPFVAREGIARLNADGSLDTTFNLNPASLGNFDAGSLFIRHAVATPNGKLYIVGSARPAGGTFSDNAPIFARLNSDGSPDGSFAPSFPVGVDSFFGVVLEPDGKVVALGSFGNNSYMNRFTDTGASDNSFTLDASLPMVSARPLRRGPLGKYILTKRDPVDGNSALVRVNANGSRDNTFNVTGSWDTPPFGSGPSTAFFNQSITSPIGKIYAGGGFDIVNGEPSVKVVAFDGDAVPNSPGTIQLGAFAFSAAECDGNMLIPVVRISGATGAASVDYSFSTSGLNATATADFDATAGTVSFAAGEAGTKYISVPLVDDSLVETIEVFSVTLANATGATLGTLTNAFASIIDSDSPPLIGIQPEPLFVAPFQFFQIAVGAISGKDPTTYQWFKDGAPISGATSPLYFQTNANAAQHDGEYCVVVTNPNGSVTSDKVDVVVKDPALLSFAASSAQAVENDGTVTLTLTRTGSSVNAVSVGLTLTNNSASPADYSISPLTISWADGDTADKTITVTLTDDSDIEPQESFIATLTNYSPDAAPGTTTSLTFTILDDDSPLTISTQPVSQSLQEDKALTLTVAATSQTPLTYQWLLDGAPLSGETSATLTIDPVELAGAGTYTVEVTNAAGTVTSDSAVVTVTPAPFLTTTAPITSDLDLEITAISLINNTTAWIAGNSSTLGFVIQKVSTNPAVPTLTIPVSSTVDQLETTSNGGVVARGFFTTVNGISQSYLARLNPDGTLASGQVPATSNPTTIAVDSMDRILISGGGLGLGRYNTDGTLDTTFSNFPDLGFNPTIDAITVDGDKVFVGGRFNTTEARGGITKLNDDGSRDVSFEQSNFNLRTRSIRVRPDGKVTILAQNPTGTVSYFVRSFDSDGTYLNNGPSVGSSYRPDFEIDNENLTLLPSNQSTYFRRLTETLAADTTFNTGLGDFNGPVKGIEVDGGGRIWVVGSFSQLNGNPVSKLVILNGTPAELAIVTEPVLAIAEPGESASFSIDVISSGAIGYQWRKDGIDIPGETAATFTIPSVSTGDAANYDVVVTNLDTSLSLTSAAAELVVLGAPIILNSPSSVTAIIGDDLTLDADFYALTPATFQWQKDSVDIAGATTADYTITSSTVADSGSYTLTITNGLGTATTVAANIQFILDPGKLVAGFVPATGGTASVTNIAPNPAGGAHLYGSYRLLNHTGGTFNNYFNQVDSTGTPLASFTATSNQNASKIARDSQGRILLAGSNIFLNGTGSLRMARISADGVSDTTFATNAASTSPRSMSHVVVDDLDRPIFGGFNTLIRLNTDGTLDSSFTAVLSGSPREVVIDSDGKILVTTSNNTLIRYLSDGSIDSTFTLDSVVPNSPAFTTFDIAEDGSILLIATDFSNRRIYRISPTGSLLSTLTSPGFTSGSLSDLAVQSDGKILLAGSISPYLVRLNPDGSPDPTFDIGTGFNNSISTLELLENGNIWVGGSFTQLDGQNVSGYAKLNGNPVDIIITSQPESLVADFAASAALNITASGFGGAPISYQWFKDGSPIVGETNATLNFASLTESDEASYQVLITNLTTGRERQSTSATITVLSVPEITLFTDEEQNLEIDDELTLSVEAIGAGALSYQWKRDGVDIPGANSASFTIAMTTEADTGSYTVEVTNSLGSITSDPVTVSVVFAPAAVNANNPDLVFNNTVETILPLPDGRTLVGGSFSSVSFNGAFNSIDEIALLNADGSLDTTFDLNPTGAIYGLSLDHDGGVLIGGRFTSIGGQSRPRFARLLPNLTVDPNFAVGVTVNNDVHSVTATTNEKYFVGGLFSNFDTSPGSYLVRVNSDGSYDDTFTPPALSSVYVTLPLPDGKVYAGGAFNGSGYTRVARFNEDGSVDNTFTASSPRTIFDLAVQSDGKLIAAGDVGGIYRYNLDGSQDSSFSSVINNDIENIEIDASGKVLLAGSFNLVNGASQSFLARLNSDGTTDESFDVRTSANASLKALALQPLGKIWIGGQHTNYRGTTTGRLTLLNGNPLDLAIVQQPASLIVDPTTTATFTVTAVGTDILSYQWLRDGVIMVDSGDISGTTTSTLSIANVDVTDEDNYQVIVTQAVTNETITSTSANLLVLGAPEILAQPTSITTEVALDATFSASTRGASPVSYQWYRDGVPLADGAKVAGATTDELTLSDLELADSSSFFLRISNGLGILDSDTVDLLVERLPAAIDRSLTLPSFNSTVRAVWPEDDGSFVVGGNFSSVTHSNGSASRRYLAKINPDGSPDLTFPQTSSGNPVYSIDKDASGRYLVAGGFTRLNANGTFTFINRVARINADGTLDTTFDPGTGPNNTVYQIRSLPDGKVLIAGPFSSVAGVAGTGRIARLNSDGSVDTTFVSQATSTVEDVALVGSDYWIAGGDYPTSPRNSRIDDTGALVSGFNFNGTLNSDEIIATSDGGAIIAGPGYPYIEKMAPDGTRSTTWPNLINGGGPNNRIYDLAPLDNSRSIVAGSFSSYSGHLGSNIAVIDANGAPETDFLPGTGFNGLYPEDMRVDSEGRIWCVGAFSIYNGEPVGKIVVLNGFTPAAADPYLDYLANFTLPPTELGETDDPDGDGLPNLLEFLYSTDPSAGPALELVSDTGSSTGGDLDTSYPGLGFMSGEDYQTFTVLVPKDLQGATLIVETSTDLQNFGDGTIDPILLESSSFNALYDIRTYAYDQPLSVAPTAYARVSATR